MKRTLILLAVLVLMSSPAFAQSLLSTFVNGPNQASDENREYLIDNVIPLDQAGAPIIGQLDVGDSLRGLLSINTMNSSGANVGGTTGVNEFTGVYQVKILNIVRSGAFGGIGDQYIFGPDPNFIGTLPAGVTAPAGSMAVLFEDPSNDFTADFDDPAPSVAPPADADGNMTNGPSDDGTPAVRTTPPSSADVSVGPYLTEEAFIATATNGTWFMTIGFAGLPGEGGLGVVTAPGFGNVLTAFAYTSGSSGATANFGMNLLAMNPLYAGGLSINRVTTSPMGGGLVDFALSQSLRGVQDLDTAFEISSNTNVSFDAVIPEPTSMLLLGAGLLGLAGVGAKKKRKA